MPTKQPLEIEDTDPGIEEEEHREKMGDAFDRAMAAAVEDGEIDASEIEDDEPKAPSKERDESGKFSKKTKAPISGEDEADNDELAPAIESEPNLPPVPVPAGWASDAAPLFNQLPPRLQHEVVKRETDLRRGMQQATEKASTIQRTWGEVEQVLAPRAALFQRAGVSPGKVVGQLMAWQDYLDQNPAAALRDLAQSYNLDLQQVVQEQAQQPQEPAYVRELRQQVQQLTGTFQQQTQAQQQAQARQQEAAMMSEVNAFSQELDASGNLTRPYVQHVIDDMLPYLAAIRATEPHLPPRAMLQKAYDKAIWANPSTRELELKKTQAMQKPSVEKARRAAKLVNGDARSARAFAEEDDVRAAMADVWDRHHGK